MEDRAIVTYNVYVVRSIASENAVQLLGGAARLRCPACSVGRMVDCPLVGSRHEAKNQTNDVNVARIPPNPKGKIRGIEDGSWRPRDGVADAGGAGALV